MDDETVLRAALRALDAAVARHQSDRSRAWDTRDEREMGAAFASLVECTFWVATLDEWLHEKHPGTYDAIRDAHPSGAHVRAMVWARDRHYHQLPFSTEPDDTPFFGEEPGGPLFYISPGLVWRSANTLAATVKRDPRPMFRPDYERCAEGKATAGPPALALAFFRELAKTTDMLPEEGNDEG